MRGPASARDVWGLAGPEAAISADPATGEVLAKYERAETQCQIQDMGTFIGSVFDDAGAGPVARRPRVGNGVAVS